MRQDRLGPLLIAILAIAAVSGCSDQLTRSRAAEIIQNEAALFSSAEVSISQDFNALLMRAPFNHAGYDLVVKLEALGYVTKSEKEIHAGSIRGARNMKVSVALTPKGEALMRRVETSSPRVEVQWRLPVCKRTFKSISRISIGNDSEAIVEYQWLYGDCLPTAEQLWQFVAESSVPIGQAQTATAILRKYDDGWRLVRS